jgi:hypothetical protein
LDVSDTRQIFEPTAEVRGAEAHFQFESLVLPRCDTGCMQIFLDMLSSRHECERIIMIADGDQAIASELRCYDLHIPSQRVGR